MIKVEMSEIDNGKIPIVNYSLGVEESKLLDSVIDKLLNEPYTEDEIRLDIDEQIFLTNFARHIGSSGVRKYIESTTVTKAEVVYDEAIIDYNWQIECSDAFNKAIEIKNSSK